MPKAQVCSAKFPRTLGYLSTRPLAVLGVLLLVLACGRERPAPLPELTAPEWQDGETSVFGIIRNDSLLFRRTVTLQFDEEKGMPTVVITDVVQPESATVYFFDSTVFALRRYSFKPLWSYQTVATDIAAAEVEAWFQDHQVTVRKQTIEGAEEKELKVGPNTCGIDMLQTILRAVPLTPGLSFRINALIPLEFRTVPMVITVLGTKLVKTQLGDIMCREISIQESRHKVRLLFELNQPHRLVAIQDIENQTETVLQQFVPGRPDSEMTQGE